tara:strand:+ start:1704 stop:2501 length:798 start_codon:yes stop_codon:yes gene_type:complete
MYNLYGGNLNNYNQNHYNQNGGNLNSIQNGDMTNLLMATGSIYRGNDNKFDENYLRNTMDKLIKKINNNDLSREEAELLYKELKFVGYKMKRQNRHILKCKKKTLFFDDVLSNFGDDDDNIQKNCKLIGCIFLESPLDIDGLAIIILKIKLGKIKNIFFDWDKTLSYQDGFKQDMITNNNSLSTNLKSFLGDSNRCKLIEKIFNSGINIIILSANPVIQYQHNENPIILLLEIIGIDRKNYKRKYSPWKNTKSEKMDRILEFNLN